MEEMEITSSDGETSDNTDEMSCSAVVAALAAVGGTGAFFWLVRRWRNRRKTVQTDPPTTSIVEVN